MLGAILLFCTPVVAGVVAGYALDGRLHAVADRLRGLWLLWAALAVQLSQYYVAPVRRLVQDRIGLPMVVPVTVLVLAWLAVNLRGPVPHALATGAILAGCLANAAVIVLNGGRMPYSPSAAARVGLSPSAQTVKHAPAGDDAVLAPLGDVVPLPVLRELVSPGDLLIGAGTAVLVAVAMRRRTAGNRVTGSGEEVRHP